MLMQMIDGKVVDDSIKISADQLQQQHQQLATKNINSVTPNQSSNDKFITV